MKILFVSLHGCIRTHKMAWTLSNMGHEVHFSAAHYAPTHSWNLYHSANLWNAGFPDGNVDIVQLAKATQLYSKVVDVIVVSNEPNWIYKVVKENTDLPVVWDIHDWTSLGSHRIQNEIDMEEWNLDNADAFIVPSKGYLRRIRERSKKPSVLVYSKVMEQLFPQAATPAEKDMPGLCYEGGVKGLPSGFEYNYPYRNWAQFAQEAVKTMKPEDKVYFYTANSGEDFKEYLNERILLSEPLVYNVLLESMGRHTAGLVGSPYPIKDFEDAMPNKLFEYVAAGIPCIVINAPEAQEYVEQNGLGMGIKDPSEVAMALEALKDHRVQIDRMAHTMEGEMPKLIELLKEMVCTNNQRAINQAGSSKTATVVDSHITGKI